jgi:uncharacterized protein (DUF1800 family)
MALGRFTGNFEVQQAALLARRAMFGATPQQLGTMVSQGLEASLDEIFNYDLSEQADNPFMPNASMKDGKAIQFSQRRWLFEMLHSPYPFRERLAFFWSNHFVVGVDKVRTFSALLYYLETLRKHGLGSFETLVLEVSKTPAMLRYLDNDENSKEHPNENFAREFLELFTLGIGNYTEQDVAEAARAFTGWSRTSGDETTFIFREKHHDTGSKTFLEQTGTWQGEDIIRLCASHEATSRFVSRKLWRAFIADVPTTEGVEDLAQTFRDTNGDLHAVLREVFSSQAFFESSGKIIKGPLEYVVGTLRSFGIAPFASQDTQDNYYKTLQGFLKQLGQVPLEPPHVAGWAGGRTWLNDGTLLGRINLAKKLTLADKLFPADTTPRTLSLALLGQETNLIAPYLEGLSVAEQAFMVLASPDYMVS